MPVDFDRGSIVVSKTFDLLDIVWSILLDMQALMLDEAPLTNDQVIQLLPSVIEIAKMANYGVQP